MMVRFQCEMACVKKVDFRVRNITPVGHGTGRQERWIMTSPNGKQRRVVLTEVGLEGWVECDVAAVVEDQVKLDVLSAGPRHIGDVEFVAIGRQAARISTGAILPVSDRVRRERGAAGIPVFGARLAPVGLPRTPIDR